MRKAPPPEPSESEEETTTTTKKTTKVRKPHLYVYMIVIGFFLGFWSDVRLVKRICGFSGQMMTK